MRHRTLAAILSLVFLLAGCTQKLKVSFDEKDEIVVTIAQSGDAARWEATFDREDPEFELFERWLDSNRYGWKPYYVTLPQGEFWVTAPEFFMIVNGESAVILYEHESVTREIEPDDLSFLFGSRDAS